MQNGFSSGAPAAVAAHWSPTMSLQAVDNARPAAGDEETGTTRGGSPGVVEGADSKGSRLSGGSSDFHELMEVKAEMADAAELGGPAVATVDGAQLVKAAAARAVDDGGGEVASVLLCAEPPLALS